MKILFVCTGNICRSPTAEAVLRKMCATAGLSGWHIDSAGTGSWHAGDAPDPRAQKAASRRDYDLSGISARSLRAPDFEEFDRIYAMAAEHYDFLRANAPDDATATIHLFLDSCGMHEDVPDPYYGNGDGFEHMMDLLEKGCRAIVKAAAAKNPDTA